MIKNGELNITMKHVDGGYSVRIEAHDPECSLQCEDVVVRPREGATRARVIEAIAIAMHASLASGATVEAWANQKKGRP